MMIWTRDTVILSRVITGPVVMPVIVSMGMIVCMSMTVMMIVGRSFGMRLILIETIASGQAGEGEGEECDGKESIHASESEGW